jgi:hypothetical protein
MAEIACVTATLLSDTRYPPIWLDGEGGNAYETRQFCAKPNIGQLDTRRMKSRQPKSASRFRYMASSNASQEYDQLPDNLQSSSARSPSRDRLARDMAACRSALPV